jgi:hypothetical protein
MKMIVSGARRRNVQVAQAEVQECAVGSRHRCTMAQRFGLRIPLRTGSRFTPRHGTGAGGAECIQTLFGNRLEWVSCSERARRFANSRRTGTRLA